MTNIIGIIQARMGSTRLPGKVMMDLVGKPVLWHVYTRVKKCKTLTNLVVATTTSQKDDIIEQYCTSQDIPCTRDSEKDVLARYYHTATQYNADIIVRITCDCPLFDPELLQNMLEVFASKYHSDKPIDYLSNALYSRTYPIGLDAEILAYDCLKKAHDEARLESEREHVTPYIYNHPELFLCSPYESDTDLSHHRWTLDTQDDYHLIKTIYDNLYPKNSDFSTNDILDFLTENPDTFKLNQHVKQNKPEQ